ncbi:hypothetical protein Dtox_3610 [Desulfofarcimen acetoxidans DSM 771]|uniref:Coat F domain protein n=1 Tax=Desulfofarcimen acetoxidans (strain ATCC 49208 / DSM 771 / KCTC 5769 / VKM B-1644 / 5575) TaxID=485916 RepID=C8VW35_DESAS|nr:hypothetical protein [Desulfofarcimen acetoxidans]ACV64322.1 hypothetical protein Dtox_3610 [Desulfofarcimen acetoxidans DSM 771]
MISGKITEREKLYLNDQLKAEELCGKKLRLFMSQTQDQNLQSVLQMAADQSQKHSNAIKGMLQESGIPVQSMQ